MPDRIYSDNDNLPKFNPVIAGEALFLALEMIKKQWKWSSNKIATLLHIDQKTIDEWDENCIIPIENINLSPTIQALMYLIAIHKSLSLMFTFPDHQIIWLETSHPELETSPETLMGESIRGLITVSDYLDYIVRRGA